MPQPYQKQRYSHSTIRAFVENQQHLLDKTPLTTQQIQTDELFKHAPTRLDGPLDLLYCFDDKEHAPALGFQQIDGDQDSEEMYSLVYLDPRLNQPWQDQGK